MVNSSIFFFFKSPFQFIIQFNLVLTNIYWVSSNRFRLENTYTCKELINALEYNSYYPDYIYKNYFFPTSSSLLKS